MTSFPGYINNTMIKFLIYFISHTSIVRQIMDVFIQDHGAYKYSNVLFFSLHPNIKVFSVFLHLNFLTEKILKIIIYRLLKTVSFQRHSLQETLVTLIHGYQFIFTIVFSFSLVYKLLISKCHQTGKYQ